MEEVVQRYNKVALLMMSTIFTDDRSALNHGGHVQCHMSSLEDDICTVHLTTIIPLAQAP